MKLLVALSLLSVSHAIKLDARVDELEAQAEVMKGLVQCLSEATACVEIKTARSIDATPARRRGGVDSSPLETEPGRPRRRDVAETDAVTG